VGVFAIGENRPAVVAMLSGEPVPTSDEGQYFFLHPRLETGDARYAWVN
jgi:Protein of unknown function (DUF3237)